MDATSTGIFNRRELFILAWILLIDVIFTIITFGNWSPRLYARAFNSNWLEVWYSKHRRTQ